jgi:phosphogluconate dehydratase
MTHPVVADVTVRNDIADLSAVVPLLARVYPNGRADVNHFHAAGGMACVISTLLDAGLMHDDVRTVAGRGLRRYGTEPRLDWAHISDLARKASSQ